MQPNVFVKPNPDKKVNGLPLLVRHPQTMRPLPASGGYVPERAAARLLRSGDVVEAAPPVKRKQAKAEKSAPKASNQAAAKTKE